EAEAVRAFRPAHDVVKREAAQVAALGRVEGVADGDVRAVDVDLRESEAHTVRAGRVIGEEVAILPVGEVETEIVDYRSAFSKRRGHAEHALIRKILVLHPVRRKPWCALRAEAFVLVVRVAQKRVVPVSHVPVNTRAEEVSIIWAAEVALQTPRRWQTVPHRD